MVFQQIFQQLAEAHDAHAHADQQGQKEQQVPFKILEQVAHRADELVVNAHRHRHGAAGHAGDDVGNADHDAPQKIQNGFHIL